MKRIEYSCVGLHVAITLNDKQINALASSIKFLMNQFLNNKNTVTANRLSMPPTKKVTVGLTTSQSKPAIKLDGKAITPVIVWYAPNAVDLSCSDERSATNAL